MLCEYCGEKHDGSFGKGRFCNIKCQAGYATSHNREEINKKISEKLKGVATGRSMPDVVYSPEAIEQREKTKRAKWESKVLEMNFDELTNVRQRKFVLMTEQNNLCACCGIEPMWNGKPLSFQLDHINGDNSDNSRDNCRCICPNCHTQTPTYGGKNMSEQSRKNPITPRTGRPVYN